MSVASGSGSQAETTEVKTRSVEAWQARKAASGCEVKFREVRNGTVYKHPKLKHEVQVAGERKAVRSLNHARRNDFLDGFSKHTSWGNGILMRELFRIEDAVQELLRR